MPLHVRMFSDDATAVSTAQERFSEDGSNDKAHHWEGNYMQY